MFVSNILDTFDVRIRKSCFRFRKMLPASTNELVHACEIITCGTDGKLSCNKKYMVLIIM